VNKPDKNGAMTMNAYVYYDDCDTYEASRFVSLEEAVAEFKRLANLPIKRERPNPVAGVQFAKSRDDLFAWEHSTKWLSYEAGEVRVLDADPRRAAQHPNALSLDD
jgi:hypothetical protein